MGFMRYLSQQGTAPPIIPVKECSEPQVSIPKGVKPGRRRNKLTGPRRGLSKPGKLSRTVQLMNNIAHRSIFSSGKAIYFFNR